MRLIRRTAQSLKFRLIFLSLGFAVLLVAAGSATRIEAQSGLVISNYRVSTYTSTYVDISWTTNLDADSRVRWGLQGAGLPNQESSSVLTQNHTLRLEPLTPDTIYEFQVGSKLEADDESERVWAPEDDTIIFQTPAGGGGGTEPPTLTSIGVIRNCCTARFIFETNRDAGYSITIVSGPNAVGANGMSASGVFQDSWDVPYPFDAGDPNLIASSDYGYTITVFDEDDNSREYGPFYFTTGNSPSDYTFTPGVCVDGTIFGTCNADGQYCGPGGLVLNCAVCGFQCQIGSTCRNGGACTDDPGTGESSFQCNPPSCYGTTCVGGANDGASCTSSGQCPGGSCTGEEFISPAGPGCYTSWQKCNANTVLKVQKDRVCNKWMTCRTQTDVQNPTTRQTEALCYDLAACAAIGPDGECAKPLYGKYCVDDPLRFCETSADCEVALCRPASGKWCSQAKKDAVSGLYEYLPCENNDTCVAEGLAPNCVDFTPANVTYTAPDDVQSIRYLTGAINAGLEWTTGPSLRVEGSFPWYFMPQEGSIVPISNSHFEERETITTFTADGTKKTTTSYTTKPWSAFGAKGSDNAEPTVLVTSEESGNQNNPNHVLKIDPTDAGPSCVGGTNDGAACNNDADCVGGGDCVAFTSGAQAPQNPFATLSTAKYVLSFRAKSASPDGQTIVARLYRNDGTTFLLKRAELTSGWQTFTTEEPITNVGGGEARLQFVRSEGSADPFYIDDIAFNTALGVRASGKNIEFVPRSCRLYPREDSLLCEYRDESGVRYKGWYGYCLERDSRYADRCLSWWPVDIIGGETDVFGTFGSEVAAGYQNRQPLFYCLEAKGVSGGDEVTYRYGSEFDPSCALPGSASREGNVRYGETSMLGYFRSSSGDCNNIGGINTYNCSGNALIAACNDKALWGECQGNNSGKSEYPVAQADKYDKSSISKIMVREIRASHGDWNFSPLVLDESNNWTASMSNAANEFRIQAFFDENQVLEKYVLYGCDGTGNDGGFAAVVEFYLREMCTKVVKVVDGDGRNRAWANRVSVGSAYQTLYSNYRFTDDLSPFGGAVPGSSDPSDWSDLLYVEAPRTNETFTFPYQTRAGLPLACNGDCSNRVCIGGGVKDGLLCRTAEDCRDTNGTQGVCSGVGTCSQTLKSCVGNRDGSGACKNRLGGTMPDEYCCSAANPDDYCIGGAVTGAGNQVFAGNQGNKCEKSGAWCYCGAGDCADPDLNPDGDALCGTYIEGDTCEIGNPDFQTTALGINALKRLFAQSYGFWVWNPTTGRYVEQVASEDDTEGPANITPPTNICQTCSNNNNLACVTNADCGGGICGINKNRGQFNEANPTSINADFCGNRTNAFGFRVNDHPKDANDNVSLVDIVDGGWVNFKFNTSADAEQLPLSSILIQWNGSEQQSIYFPYAPKSDKDAPHSISHRYFCSEAILENLSTCAASAKDRTYPCKTGSSCVYQPRVIVQDNWGWCNGVPPDFQTGASCTSDPCDNPSDICEPRYQVCVNKADYQDSSQECSADANFPPSWRDSSNGTFDQGRPIEVRVQSSGD